MLNAGGLGSGLVEVRRGLTRPLPLQRRDMATSSNPGGADGGAEIPAGKIEFELAEATVTPGGDLTVRVEIVLSQPEFALALLRAGLPGDALELRRRESHLLESGGPFYLTGTLSWDAVEGTKRAGGAE